MNIDALKGMLTKHEGIRFTPYRDTVGKLTIGVGHNLDDKPLSKAVVMQILDEDITDVIHDLDNHLPWWRSMDETRQLVLADMCFNMGIGTLLGFKNTLKAMEEGRYDDAASGMGQSLWAVQVGQRATHLISMMQEGK